MTLIWYKNPRVEDQWSATGEYTGGFGFYVITSVQDPDTHFLYYELEANGRVLPDQFVELDEAKAAAEKIEEKRK